MRYIEAPEQYDSADNPEEPLVFLAGGITDCPDWQRDMVALFLKEGTGAVVLNPRRAHFPILDPNAAADQIRWEHVYLKKADAILFWFCKETLCPIVLYELGAWSSVEMKPIFIGMDPKYERRRDVEIQTRLVRPGLHIQYSLKGLAGQVLTWEANRIIRKGVA